MRNHQLLFALDLLPSSAISSFGTGTTKHLIPFFFFPLCTRDSVDFFHIPLVLSFPHWSPSLLSCSLSTHFQTFSISGAPTRRQREPETFWESTSKYSSCSSPLPWHAGKSSRSKESGDAEDQRNSHLKITYKYRPTTTRFKVLSSSSLSRCIFFSLCSVKPASWSLTQVLKVQSTLTCMMLQRFFLHSQQLQCAGCYVCVTIVSLEIFTPAYG